MRELGRGPRKVEENTRLRLAVRCHQDAQALPADATSTLLEEEEEAA